MSRMQKQNVLSIALFLSCGVGAMAQTPAAPAPAKTVPGSSAEKSGQTPKTGSDAGADAVNTKAHAPYRLAGDDVIGVSVVNFPELSKPQIAVLADGMISVPVIPSFSVLGMTTSEVEKALTDKWSKFVINPSVSVSLVQKRKDSVLLYGYVIHPGATEYRPAMRLLEALGQAGGALVNGDLAHVTLTRKSGEKRVLDLSHPDKKQGTEVDIALQVDDVIYVPLRHDVVSVTGEVRTPGEVEFKDDMTVQEAITAAGGYTSETADLSKALLQHNGKDQPLDLEALYRRGDTQYDRKLAPGDRLFIPEIKDRTYVFGSVNRPGFYKYKPGDTILDALNYAGGNTPEGDMGKVRLLHVSADKKSAKMDTFNMTKFFNPDKQGNVDLKSNATLHAGDVLYVPARKKKFGMNDLWGALTGVNLVSGLGRIMQGRFY